MWVVALALISVIGAQGMVPDMQSRLPHGIQTLTPPVELTPPSPATPMMPLSERTGPVLVQAQPPADTAEDSTNRVIRCVWRGEDGALFRSL
jgi:hypothetical protein